MTIAPPVRESIRRRRRERNSCGCVAIRAAFILYVLMRAERRINRAALYQGCRGTATPISIEVVAIRCRATISSSPRLARAFRLSTCCRPIPFMVRNVRRWAGSSRRSASGGSNHGRTGSAEPRWAPHIFLVWRQSKGPGDNSPLSLTPPYPYHLTVQPLNSIPRPTQMRHPQS